MNTESEYLIPIVFFIGVMVASLSALVIEAMVKNSSHGIFLTYEELVKMDCGQFDVKTGEFELNNIKELTKMNSSQFDTNNGE